MKIKFGKFVLLTFFTVFLGLKGYSHKNRFEMRTELSRFELVSPEIVVTSKDSIFIFDDKLGKVLKFDWQLNLLKQFGKKGEGPGEFGIVNSMGIYENLLWLYDLRGKVIFYDLDGNYQYEKSRMAMGEKGSGMASLIGILPGQVLLLQRFEFDKNGWIKQLFYLRRDDSQEKVLAEMILLSGNNLQIGKQNIVAYSLKKVYLVPDSQYYEIKVFNIKKNDFEESIVQKNFKRVKYSKEEKNELVQNVERLKRVKNIANNVNVTLCEFKPAISDLIADEHDNLYVVSYLDGEEKRVVVYKDQKMIGSEYLSGEFKLIGAFNGSLVLIKESEESYFLEIFKVLNK